MRLKIFNVLIFALFASAPAWSQSEAVSAQLSGTVQDENGASIPGAKVTLSIEMSILAGRPQLVTMVSTR
ncbi:MAG: hypothetical protein QOE55_1420 [Acidobacteriaceae bacterium]|nr:hypothetical protein [Acidobacteriaceae bacterium]